MNAIADLFKDPAWWFTAVVVGIFASVIAGFAKDYISLLASKVSVASAKRRERKLEVRKASVEAMIADSRYMYIMILLAIISLLFTMVLIIVFFESPILLTAVPEADSTLRESRDLATWRILAPTVGILANIMAYLTTSRLSVIYEAIREYCKRNGLPPAL
jgi:hypothetical protein